MWLERGGLTGLVLLMAVGSMATAAARSMTDSVVVAGGGLTEILYALGVEDQIAGVDTTSTWPQGARTKPQVGYLRALAAEGILSLSPTLVITTDEAGPPSVLKLVEAAGVPVQEIPAPRSPADVARTIRQLAMLFGRPAKGQALIDDMEASLDAAAQTVARYARQPRVLFLLASGSQLLAGGRDTAADAMIRLAGGVNVTTHDGYKPLTPEAAARLAPQVILTVDYVIDEVGGRTALLAQPALSLTPAGRNGRLIAMDAERLLGFGPRLGQTVAALARRLHGEDQP